MASPAMDAGKLDRRLSILRAGLVDDGFQTVPGDFETVATLWASREDISDGERGRASGVSATATSRFQVRHSTTAAAITPQDRLSEGGQTFDILGIKQLGRRIGLEITASRRADV
ncbi:MAG: head-tail adaptor protein [Brevundimonas sp.]|uniref:head-tail adaptor protein n=1 Tax=Brevundimonas sp. TaxID=1871086 RepID=UPI0040336BE6